MPEGHQFLVAEPKRAPEEALPEAKRRLLTGDWYDAEALAPAYRAETTATLIRRFYPLGMRKALEPVLAGQRNVEGCNRILADWPLTEHWRGLVPPAGERTKAASDQLTTFFEALHADAGEKLIADTLAVFTDPAQLAARPEVQIALQRLAGAFVCFGRTNTPSDSP